MLYILTFFEVLKNNPDEFEFLFEIPEVYNPTIYSYKIAIPPDGYYEISYEVLNYSKLNYSDILNLSSDKVFEVNRKNAIDLEYIELKINPYYKVNDELYIRNKIKFRVKFYLSESKKVGDYLPHHREFINFPFPKSWIKKKVLSTPPDFFSMAQFWIKIKIKERGVYKISAADLINLGILQEYLTINRISLFAKIDTFNSSLIYADSLIKQVSIHVYDENGDGILNQNDYILFFGEGSEGFRNYNNSIVFYRNPYDVYSYYILGINSNIPPKFMTITNFNYGQTIYSTGMYRHDSDLINTGKKGRIWLGEEIKYSNSFNFNLEGIVSNTGSLTLSIVGAEPLAPNECGNGKLQIVLNNQELDNNFIVFDVQRTTKSYNISNLQYSNNISINVLSSNCSNPRFYLDYFEVRYTRNIPEEGSVYFQTTASARITNNALMVLDITNLYEPVILNNFSDNVVPNKIYFISKTYLKPLSIEIINITENLYSLSNVEYIIIGPNDWFNSINNYIEFRKRYFPTICGVNFCIDSTGFHNVKYISIENVFEQFGFGMKDPVAIRNFLYTLYRNSQNLLYGLLLGDATYDYRNILQKGGNILPVYYDFNESFDINLSFAGSFDDFYFDFSGDRYADINYARFPARDKSEVFNYFKKVIDYELNRFFSDWKNRLLLVADDFSNPYPCESSWHLLPSDNIQKFYIPKNVIVHHLYMHEYPLEGGRKPTANRDFIDRFNNGYLLINIFSHGNPSQIASEMLLSLMDVQKLNAYNKPPFVLILSCKTNVFDRLDGDLAGPKGLGEYLVTYTGGAIGVLSSTALSFVGANVAYAQQIFSALKTNRPYPMGYISKLGKNNWYYVLFGDPSVMIGYPDTNSNLSFPDSAFVGALYKGSFLETKNYSVSISLIPSTRVVVDATCSPPQSYNILEPHRILYRAYINTDSLKVFIPKDLNPNRKLQLRGVYAYSNKFKDSISLGFKAELIEQDNEGPKLKLLYYLKEVFDSSKFTPKVRLTLWASDEHGIYLSPGYRDVEIYIDDVEVIKLTDKFIYEPNSFTTGSADFELDFSNNQGWHKLTLRAFDNYNNFSTKDYYLNFSDENISVYDLLVYPNPYKKGPFYITFNSNSQANAQFKIYTLNSNLIYASSRYTINPGFNVLKLENLDIGSGLYILVLELKKENRSLKVRKKFAVVK
ncbi:MAG: C25 family cysteine peptidase [candidate division WOR-3 bacterium]|nr:C25 family cysteine peptidase [candidate division WOR-3 bacterium]MDW8150452.1 C25 family cysteine peptidase [candidate division WOR-3 bacterium]